MKHYQITCFVIELFKVVFRPGIRKTKGFESSNLGPIVSINSLKKKYPLCVVGVAPVAHNKKPHLKTPCRKISLFSLLLPVLVLISLTSSRSIGFVQLNRFSPDNFLAGNGLSAVDSATLRRANGPDKIVFHT